MKQSNKEHLNEKGFTLIEVLIGLTLVTVISLGMVSVIDTVTSSLDTISSEDPPYYQLEAALNRIDDDLSSMYNPLFFSVKQPELSPEEKEKQAQQYYETSETFPNVNEYGEKIPLIDNPDKSTFIFFTNSNKRILKNNKESNFSWIRYTIKDDKSPKDEFEEKSADAKDYDKVLIKNIVSKNIYANEFDWDNSKDQILLKNVKSLEFFFWDSNKEKFIDKLEFLNELKEKPRLFKIRLLWRNPGSGENREINRLIRVNWPNFDAKKDFETRQNILKPKSSGNSTSNSGGIVNPGTNTDNQGDNDDEDE